MRSRDEKERLKELKERLPKGHYTETQPITFYTEHLDRKSFYKSAGIGLNPFARTSGFTQRVPNTRGVCNYEGNVNFGKETAIQQKLSTIKDFYQENPYQSYPMKTIYNHTDLKQIFAEMSHDYTFGIRQIRKFLNDCDLNGNGYLEPGEVKYLLSRIGLTLVSSLNIVGRREYADNFEKYGQKQGRKSFH